MTIAAVDSLGTGAHATSASSFTLTTSAALEANNVGILVVVTDNSRTTEGGGTNEHTSVSGGTGTWTKLGEHCNANAAAAAGVTTSVWMFRPTVDLASGSVVTMNLTAAVVDKCASFHEFTVGAALIEAAAEQTNGIDASNGFGSVSFSGLASAQRLYFRGLGKEANSVTALTPTTNFTAITGTRSRNNASAVIVRGEFRINTSTGETSNPTLAVSGDTAGVFVALEEQVASDPVRPPIPENPVWRKASGVTTIGANLLLTTLAVAGATDVVRAPLFARIPQKSLQQSATAPNLLVSTLAEQAPAPTPFANHEWPNPRGRRALDLTWLVNLQQSTLAVAEAAPFAQSDWPNPQQRQRVDGTQALNLQLTTLATPFRPVEWPNPAVVRSREYGFIGLPQLQEEAPVAAPFVPQDWSNPQATKWPVEFYTFIGRPQLESVAETTPFATFEWPNPVRGAQSPLGEPGINLLLSTLTVTPDEPVVSEWIIRARRRGRR